MNPVEKIAQLKKEINEKLTEMRQISLDTDTPASFEMGYTTYEVFLESAFDPDDVGWVKENSGKEFGDWISSSDQC